MASNQRRGRRRVQRPSDAAEIDRSWDTPEGAAAFAEPKDPSDPRSTDDVVVDFDETPGAAAEDTSDLDEDYWKQQQPPHFGN